MYRKQSGASALGIIFMIAIGLFFVILGFRVVPVFSEYIGIKNMIREVVNEHPNGTPAEIKEAFNRKFAIEYATAVTAKDLVISKENGAVSIFVAYDKPIRLFGEDNGTNIDLNFHFEIQEGKKPLKAEVGE